MGSSTTAQLIARGKAENAYNNSGIKTDTQWVDFFNDALRDLADDLRIEKVGTINLTTDKREYDLPDDYYAIIILNDGTNNRMIKRRNYDQQYPPGFWIFYRGGKYVIDLWRFTNDQTFSFMYQAYAATLGSSSSAINQEKPEIPSVGEKALIYFAIAKALRNNSHLDEAKEYERLYEAERLKIRTAAVRGGGT